MTHLSILKKYHFVDVLFLVNFKINVIKSSRNDTNVRIQVCKL